MWKNYDKWNGITATNKHIIEEYCNYRLKVLKKSESTIVNEEKTLRKLTKYFKNKELDKLTDKDLQKIFSDDKFVKKRSTADLHATNTILFYKWMFKLPKNERPKNMYWYEYQKRIDKEKNSNPNKKEEQFITREEYDSIIQNSSHPQNKATWELLYLSGARDGEILGMKNTDVKTLKNGWEIIVNHSKTKPRRIPLPETPGNLLYWIRNHPLIREKEFPLWISLSNKSYGNPLKRSSAIVQRFTADKKRAKIKKNFTPHSFRRTRATIMFGENYTDKEMAIHFGWRISSVPMRREEYDLTDYNDLREKVFKKSENPQKFENMQAELERQDHLHNEEKEEWRKDRDEFRKQVSDVKNLNKALVEEFDMWKEVIAQGFYLNLKHMERDIEEGLRPEWIKYKDDLKKLLKNW